MGNASSELSENTSDIWWTPRPPTATAGMSTSTQTDPTPTMAEAPQQHQSLADFKLELEAKHEKRRQLIIEKRKEMVQMKDDLEQCKQENQQLKTNSEVPALKSELERYKRENAELKRTSAFRTEVNALKEENEDLLLQVEKLKIQLKDGEEVVSKNKELRINIAEMQAELQNVNGELVTIEQERLEYANHISALKDVVRVTKDMLLIRENQIEDLKTKIKTVEELLASKEMKIMSDSLREEYERQLRNIRNLRALYDERQRLDKRDKESLQEQLDDSKKKIEEEQKINTELQERIVQLENDTSAKYDTINSLQSNLGLSKAECKELQAEIDIINQLFSQVLLGFKNSQEIDLDKLIKNLEENHELLTNMATNEGSDSTAAALPKLLLDLINQMNKESDSACGSNENLESVTHTVHEPNSAEEIVETLPKVWKVMIELLSHQTPPLNVLTGDSADLCYKSIETPTGPKLKLSVSQTFIRLKDLILEKKFLERETYRLKHLNTHLESRLQDQEARLGLVSGELKTTWHVVDKMQKQHQQLHTHEKVMRYELHEKRKLLNELKQELQYCREKWAMARVKNDTTQAQWKELRKEFADRKKRVTDDFNQSGESGYSDAKDSSEDERGYESDVEADAKKPDGTADDHSEILKTEELVQIDEKRQSIVPENQATGIEKNITEIDLGVTSATSQEAPEFRENSDKSHTTEEKTLHLQDAKTSENIKANSEKLDAVQVHTILQVTSSNAALIQQTDENMQQNNDRINFQKTRETKEVHNSDDPKITGENSQAISNQLDLKLKDNEETHTSENTPQISYINNNSTNDNLQTKVMQSETNLEDAAAEALLVSINLEEKKISQDAATRSNLDTDMQEPIEMPISEKGVSNIIQISTTERNNAFEEIPSHSRTCDIPISENLQGQTTLHTTNLDIPISENLQEQTTLETTNLDVSISENLQEQTTLETTSLDIPISKNLQNLQEQTTLETTNLDITISENLQEQTTLETRNLYIPISENLQDQTSLETTNLDIPISENLQNLQKQITLETTNLDIPISKNLQEATTLETTNLDIPISENLQEQTTMETTNIDVPISENLPNLQEQTTLETPNLDIPISENLQQQTTLETTNLEITENIQEHNTSDLSLSDDSDEHSILEESQLLICRRIRQEISVDETQAVSNGTNLTEINEYSEIEAILNALTPSELAIADAEALEEEAISLSNQARELANDIKPSEDISTNENLLITQAILELQNQSDSEIDNCINTRNNLSLESSDTLNHLEDCSLITNIESSDVLSEPFTSCLNIDLHKDGICSTISQIENINMEINQLSVNICPQRISQANVSQSSLTGAIPKTPKTSNITYVNSIKINTEIMAGLSSDATGEHFIDYNTNSAQNDSIISISNSSMSTQIGDNINLNNDVKTQSPINSPPSASISSSDEIGHQISVTSPLKRSPEEILAAREERLKRLEEDCKTLVTKVTNTSQRSVDISNKLDTLHETYGPGKDQESQENPDWNRDDEGSEN